jgi:hypothetical protein
MTRLASRSFAPPPGCRRLHQRRLGAAIGCRALASGKRQFLDPLLEDFVLGTELFHSLFQHIHALPGLIRLRPQGAQFQLQIMSAGAQVLHLQLPSLILFKLAAIHGR